MAYKSNTLVECCAGCGADNPTITCVNCEPSSLVRYCAHCAAWCHHSHSVPLRSKALR